MSIRVLIVDDSNLFRLGLSALLSANTDFAVIGNLRSSKEALQTAGRLDPDVVLMNEPPSLSGLEDVAQLKRRHPSIKVVMLTAFKSEDYVRQALRTGVDGYLLRDTSIDELFMAIRYVAQGKNYLSPDVSTEVVQTYLHPNRSGTRASRLESLTSRERSILQLIAEGRTNRTAAEYLSVSPKTVEKHRAALMHKLGLRNAVELTLMALEMGIIERPLSLARMASSANSGDGVAA
jgi:DNA-binding NarL/FixJ family response regulator